MKGARRGVEFSKNFLFLLSIRLADFKGFNGIFIWNWKIQMNIGDGGMMMVREGRGL
jgi:hypothetical protein